MAVLPIGSITLPLRLEWTSLSTLESVAVDQPPTHLLTFFGSLEVTQLVHNPGRLHAVYDTGQLFAVKGIFGLQKLHLIVDTCAGIRIALVVLRISLETPFVKVKKGGTDDVIVAI